MVVVVVYDRTCQSIMHLVGYPNPRDLLNSQEDTKSSVSDSQTSMNDALEYINKQYDDYFEYVSKLVTFTGEQKYVGCLW